MPDKMEKKPQTTTTNNNNKYSLYFKENDNTLKFAKHVSTETDRDLLKFS